MDEVIDEGMTLTLDGEIFADLSAELQQSDGMYNETLLLAKIRNAMREVRRARKYPQTYTDEMITQDLYNFYSNILNIARYDYNTIGIEGQSGSSENGVSRTYVDRNKLFSGVIPLTHTSK
jgi:hypothetical protein